MKYTIVTGFFSRKGDGRAEFFNKWYENTLKYSNPLDIFVINANSEELPEKRGKWIDLSFNLGHVHDLDKNNYPDKKFCGWSMAFMQACLLAYSNDTDLVFKEQDCLAFNDWVQTLYDDCEGLGVVMGRPQDADNQALEQSLFLIKKGFLLDFVKLYLALQEPDAGVGFLRPEFKFREILQRFFKGQWGFTRMGYGRTRLKNITESILTGEPFYVQKLFEKEIKELC